MISIEASKEQAEMIDKMKNNFYDVFNETLEMSKQYFLETGDPHCIDMFLSAVEKGVGAGIASLAVAAAQPKICHNFYLNCARTTAEIYKEMKNNV